MAENTTKLPVEAEVESPQVEKKKEKSPKKVNEFLYFATRNTKLKIGFFMVLFFILVAILGPMTTKFEPRERHEIRNSPPTAEHPMGTTKQKEDLYSQFVHGVGSALLIGLMAGSLGTFIGLTVGFVAGYRGGILDEFLMMITNIVLVMPTFALFIIIGAYLPFRGVTVQALLLGCISWPWVARAVRSQTLSLKQREFVNLSRISGVSPIRTIIEEIAPNMMSYVVMIFILLFGGSILYAVALDFIGLGPTKGISLGLMMMDSANNNAIQYGYWWWFIPPGLSITLIVGGMYLMNTGLDEVFNPKLRDL